MNTHPLSEEQVARFEKDGYLLVPQLFDSEEVDLLRKIAKADAQLAQEARERLDAEGGLSKLSLRNDLREDIYSAITRCRRIVDSMEQLLGGEVYHYHHKMMMKEPFVGGAWEWHQDYGYWYNNGCLFPYMASCMIAVDRATRENGCLQVLRGSHHMGRLNHGRIGEQTGADPEHVQAALERLELVYAEMEPGDALFFHCNLLHRSDQNRSPNPRWVLICCYNAARNNPYKESGHPRYSYLEKWPDERVKEIGRRQWEAMQREMAGTGG
ncbi:MAG TPA: phytanoyl-CoA dioxygenase family protein [Chthonomonadales bacterium]|nr:phytanoyl-CoA dioxygenase family protein [Chthonomonadales bacterium]